MRCCCLLTCAPYSTLQGYTLEPKLTPGVPEKARLHGSFAYAVAA